MTPSNLPFLYWGFIVLSAVTLSLFYWLTGKNKLVLLAGVGWLALTAVLARQEVFLVTDVIPPRLAFLIVPMLVGGLLFGFSRWTAKFRAPDMLEGWHYFHGIRIVVETVFLHGLWQAGFLAREVTFSGSNFDIIPGVLGLLVGFLVFRKRILSHNWAIAFNVIGILVLANTVVQAVLSAPSPFQQFSFEQPTIAVLYFPWVWLPAFVAPLMFWAHFVSLKLLLSPKNQPSLPD
ncbi:MAG: hypothetical protein AAF597_07530 [Bacteroidota bacterium]